MTATTRRATEVRISVRDDNPVVALADAMEDVPDGYEVVWISLSRRTIGEGSWQATVTARREER